MDGTLVNPFVTSGIKFVASYFLDLIVKKGTLKVKYLTQEHNTIGRIGILDIGLEPACKGGSCEEISLKRG